MAQSKTTVSGNCIHTMLLDRQSFFTVRQCLVSFIGYMKDGCLANADSKTKDA